MENHNPASFSRESQIKRLDSTTFSANLAEGFCVYKVPNGGYVASIFLRVASAYLASRNQPDTVIAHWHFLNPTAAGPAILIVDEAKLGRGLSTVHITLYQGGLLPQSPWIGPKSKKRVVAYMTNSQLDAEHGITLPTQYEIETPPPPADLAALAQRGEDDNWVPLRMLIMMYVPTLFNFEFYRPRQPAPRPALYDFWLRFANGEPITPAALGILIDTGPPLLVESFRPEDLSAPVPAGGFAGDRIFWYPTVTMSLEVKKKLPAAGVPWLRMRVAAKVLRNGRYDAEVVVLDEAGDVVALSNHVALAVDSERNSSRDEKL